MSAFFQHKGLILVAVTAATILCALMVWVYFSHPPAAVGTPVLIVTPSGAQVVATTTLLAPDQFQYIEVVDGCNPYYVGTCVNMRSGPGADFPVVERLRTGVVLRVAGTATRDGHDWYKIQQDAGIRYPERITSDWYVYADAVQLFTDEGDKSLTKTTATTTKHIVVDISQEMLYAYDGDVLFMQEPISTGLEFTPTPRGTFSIFKKTPSRYMQGPIPGVSDQKYDLPGVPWNLYFTVDGAVIHGAYWHDHFGQPWSHGCVNLSPENAKKLYQWADVGTKVLVQ